MSFLNLSFCQCGISHWVICKCWTIFATLNKSHLIMMYDPFNILLDLVSWRYHSFWLTSDYTTKLGHQNSRVLVQKKTHRSMEHNRESRESTATVGSNVNWYDTVENSMELPQKTENRTTMWFSNSIPGCISRKKTNTSLKRYTQDMEANQVFINRQMNKEDVVYIYTGALLSHKKNEIILLQQSGWT